MNKIVLVDDDAKFSTTFINLAATHGIIVTSLKSLEKLKQILPKFTSSYAAVVLDVKCLLVDDQAKEDESFIGAAISYLDSNVSGFPRFILTADDSSFDVMTNFHAQETVFIKDPDSIERLFRQLSSVCENSEILRIKRKNSKVFSIFESDKLEREDEVRLLEVLKSYDETDRVKFKINLIRTIHENIYKSLNRRNLRIVPLKYLDSNGSPSFVQDFYNHLLGNPDKSNKHAPTTTVFQDSTIQSITRFIHSSCSEFIHDNSKTKYTISAYTYKALINALLELIIWSDGY